MTPPIFMLTVKIFLRPIHQEKDLLMKKNQVPFKKVIFVCLNKRETGACCAQGGSETIHAQLKAGIKERGLNTEVRVSRSGCLNRCTQGPNIMVFPDNVWYSEVTQADVPQLLSDIAATLADTGCGS